MNQLLNIPMPAEKALKIMDTIHQSNGSITIQFKYFSLASEKEETCFWAGHMAVVWNEIDKEQPITINSITQIIPTYSIGDKVLILSTGEIGEVTNDITKFERWMYVVWESCFHRSEIAKLPNDL